MKKIYILFLTVLFISCSEESPVTGIYQMTDKRLSAIIIDSTIYLMTSSDTAFIYDLQIHSHFQIDSVTTLRIYNVVFRNSLNRNGYESIDIPTQFEYASNFGGTLIASFINGDSFVLGGYAFFKQINPESKKIFDSWTDLIKNNLQTRLWDEYQDQ